MNKKVLIALGCASMLICGCDNNVQEPEQNGVQEVVEKIEFKTTDGEVTFKKVETTQEIIDEFKKDMYDQSFSLDYIQEYAYVNNIVYAISQKEEDDTYAKYSGYFSASVGAQYNIIFLINKTTGEIIEVNKIVDDSYNYNEVSGLIARFSGETNSVDFFKTDAGYFFVRHTMNPDIIYTTSLKKLGMVDDYKKIKADSEGIYVYTEYSEDIEPVESSYTKFNSSGVKIKIENQDSISKYEKVYQTKDGKFKLSIVSSTDEQAASDYYDLEKENYYRIAKNNCSYSTQYYYYGKNYDCDKIDSEFGDLFKKSFSMPEIEAYAYLNEHLLAISRINEDDVYAYYSGVFPENKAQYLESFLVEKSTNKIIELNDYVLPSFATPEDEWKLRFNGESSADLGFVKTNIGYFIIQYTIANNILYTTDLKQIGYVGEIKEDKDGVYAYDNMGLEGTPSKYNIKGEKIG